MNDFYRIQRLPPYVFEQVNRIKAAARARGADIIDLGMGNPDLPAPKHVMEKLVETVGKPRTDRYSSSRGIPGLRRAQAEGRAAVVMRLLAQLGDAAIDQFVVGGGGAEAAAAEDAAGD